MKKILALLVLLTMVTSTMPAAMAETHGTNGQVTGKSIGAGALSLLVWPGLGQILNGQSDKKVITHALLGLTGVFRIWSCYDGVVARNGGVWENRI